MIRRRSLLALLGLAPLAPVARLAPALGAERVAGSLTWSGLTGTMITGGTIRAEKIVCNSIGTGVIPTSQLYPRILETPVLTSEISAQDRLVGALSLGG